MIRRACSIWFAPFAGPPDLYPRTGLSVVAANSGRSAVSFWGAGGRQAACLLLSGPVASAGHPTGRLCPLSAGVRHGLLARLPAVLRLRHRRLLDQTASTVPPLPFASNLPSITAPNRCKARSSGLSGSPAGASRRIKNLLVQCSRRIFGLGSRNAGEPRLAGRGTRRRWRCGSPASGSPIAAEQVALALADPGDAVLPGQHAGPLQHLQRLGDGAAGALCLGGDRLVAREAAAGAGVVEAPQQRLQHVQEGAGDRALVLARLAVAGAPGASRRPAMRALALRSSGTARPGPNTFSRRAVLIRRRPSAQPGHGWRSPSVTSATRPRAVGPGEPGRASWRYASSATITR